MLFCRIRIPGGTKINESIIIENGSSLIGTDSNGHKLQLKQGIKIEGLPLYVRYNNDYISANSIISELWKLPDFSRDEYVIVAYDSKLKGWFFEHISITEDSVSDSLKKKLKTLNSKRK